MIINSLYINRIYYVLYYNSINTNNVKIQLLYIDPNINDHIIVRRIILIIHILYIFNIYSKDRLLIYKRSYGLMLQYYPINDNKEVKD